MNLKNYWISKLIIILGIFFLNSANADIKIKASQQVSNFLNTIKEFASLIISTKQVLNIKSNFKSFGIIFLSFLIIVFLSVSFVMSRMSALPVGNSV